MEETVFETEERRGPNDCCFRKYRSDDFFATSLRLEVRWSSELSNVEQRTLVRKNSEEEFLFAL